jgi:Carboxypeptidase regulatory-like domain/TonB dependent receptor
MKRNFRLFALFTVSVLFSAMATFGQAGLGSIAGTARDATGAAIAAATVRAKNVSTSAERSTQTGNDGRFELPGLVPGLYDVTVSSAGFKNFASRVEVTVGGTATIEAELSVSNQTTTVEVVATGGVEVNTQTQELSQIVNTQQMAALPSLTRNPYDFVEISGNVTNGDRTATGMDQSTTNRGVGFALNGQRTSGTEILLDGVENLDLFGDAVGEQIPLDSVQEFRVITNNFDAQYGRASGGVVNVATKSGTSSFHGSAWEFNRLSAYTSNTYANAIAGLPKGGYTRNQFGYAVGGPIPIGRMKNKLFFFQSTEWLRVRSNAILQAYVPTPEFLSLTAPNVQSYFSTYGANPFAFGGTLTQAQVQAQVGSMGPFAGVAPGTPVLGLVNYTAPSDSGGGVPQNTHRIMGRLDFNATNNTQMFFRYALENIVDFNGSDYASPYSQYNVGDASYNNMGLFSINHSFSPSVFSNSKISFSRLKFDNTQAPVALTTPELLITPGPTTINGIPIQLPGAFAQFAGTGGLPAGGPTNVLQLTEDLSWTKGKHTIRFGGLYDYQQMNRTFAAYGQAIEELGAASGPAFDNLMTGGLAQFQAAVSPEGNLPCHTDPVSGTIIQTPSCTLTLPTTQPSFARSFRYQDWAAYLEDSFRVTPRFTFNYGVRYEYFGVQHNDNQNLDSNFYFGPGSSYYQTVANGTVQAIPNSPVGAFWNPNYGTIGPRIGFAYDVSGNGKTAVRGGYGISYERNFGNVTFNAIQNPPAYASLAITAGESGVTAPTVTVSNLGPFSGTGTLPVPPVELRHMNQNIDVAQTQFMSLALEHQVARNAVFAVEYAGAHGIHLYDIAASNPLGGAQFYLGVPFDGTDYTRPNNQFASINTRGSNGSSHYNALNVRFQTQNVHNTGLSVTANYTFAHSTDDLSSTFSDSTGGASSGIGNLGYLNPSNPRLDWGSSDFDIRHRFVVTPIWELPWLKSGRDWKHEVAGGWTLVGIFTVRSGVPFSIFDTTNSLNAPSGYGIPRYVPSTPIAQYTAGTPVQQTSGGVPVNSFTVLTLPAANTTPFDPALASAAFPAGISDFGPFPGNMTGRNAFRGPGAWNLDAAVTKSLTLTERLKLEFRAEGFDVLNHHNYYVNALTLNVPNFSGGPVDVTALKGGLGTNNVAGTNHDERRFGQFALRLIF